MFDSTVWISTAAVILTLIMAFALCLPFMVLHKVEAGTSDLDNNGLVGASVGSAYLTSLGLQCALLGLASVAGHTIDGGSSLEFRFALGFMLGGMILSVISLATWNIFLSPRTPADLRARILSGALGINAAMAGVGLALCAILCSIGAVTTSISKRGLVMAGCYLVITVAATLLAVQKPKATDVPGQQEG